MLDVKNCYSACESWLTSTWGKLPKSLRDTRQKAVKRGTQHWTCNIPALLTWMDSASTSLDLISEAGLLADSDISDVDLDSANVETHSQVVEVSVHQGPVKGTSTIVEAGRAPTMDNFVPWRQRGARTTSGSYTQCAPPCTQYKCPAVLLLVPGPSFPPGTRASISMLPGMPIVFSGAPGAPAAPYSSMQSTSVSQGAAIQPMAERRGLVRPSLTLLHLWPLHLGQCISMPSYMPMHSRPLCKLSLGSLPGNAKIWRPESSRPNV